MAYRTRSSYGRRSYGYRAPTRRSYAPRRRSYAAPRGRSYAPRRSYARPRTMTRRYQVGGRRW